MELRPWRAPSKGTHRAGLPGAPPVLASASVLLPPEFWGILSFRSWKLKSNLCRSCGAPLTRQINAAPGFRRQATAAKAPGEAPTLA